MAAPVIATSAVTSISTAADPWTVNYPASIDAGDLLMLFARSASTASLSVPSGWTNSGLGSVHSNDASDDWNAVYWKIAAGTESGTFSWDVHTATTKGAVIIVRITGHGCGPGTTNPPTFSTDFASYTTANQNPALLNPGTSADWLFLTGLGQDGEGGTYTSPSGYTTRLLADSGTGGAVATNCTVVIASKGTTAVTSDDPGAWVNPAPANGGSIYGGWVRPLVPVDPRGAAYEARIMQAPEGRRTQRRW